MPNLADSRSTTGQGLRWRPSMTLAEIRLYEFDAVDDRACAHARVIMALELDMNVRIVRLQKPTNDALSLLNEYYEAINVTQRDTLRSIRETSRDKSAGIWLAYLNEQAVGCVLLKRLPSIPIAGECKRLYVKPDARGLGIASKMLDALEAFAREKGLSWIYLDSFDALEAAIMLYERRGYVSCDRYNENPQATLFLRKKL